MNRIALCHDLLKRSSSSKQRRERIPLNGEIKIDPENGVGFPAISLPVEGRNIGRSVVIIFQRSSIVLRDHLLSHTFLHLTTTLTVWTGHSSASPFSNPPLNQYLTQYFFSTRDAGHPQDPIINVG